MSPTPWPVSHPDSHKTSQVEGRGITGILLGSGDINNIEVEFLPLFNLKEDGVAKLVCLRLLQGFL
jgi:hypothetical protein